MFCNWIPALADAPPLLRSFVADGLVDGVGTVATFVPLMAVFFAFNLFVCINVMLPLVWRISNAAAMRMSAALALIAFITILFGRRRLRSPRSTSRSGSPGT